MGDRSDDERRVHGTDRRLESTLSALKQRGSALLIVGSVPADSYIRACSWLLGDDAAGPRRHLFVTTDADLPRVGDRFTPELNRLRRATTEWITWSSCVRRAHETQSVDRERLHSRRAPDGNLPMLGARISEAIRDIDDSANGLAPAELRLCLDSLESLVSEFDRESVFRFLHILIGRLRSVRGMGHFHLPVERESEVVSVFAELFDATVELRLGGDGLQQRWHLHEADLTSNWLSVSPA